MYVFSLHYFLQLQSTAVDGIFSSMKLSLCRKLLENTIIIRNLTFHQNFLIEIDEEEANFPSIFFCPKKMSYPMYILYSGGLRGRKRAIKSYPKAQRNFTISSTHQYKTKVGWLAGLLPYMMQAHVWFQPYTMRYFKIIFI